MPKPSRLVNVLVLLLFIVYATFRAFQNALFEVLARAVARYGGFVAPRRPLDMKCSAFAGSRLLDHLERVFA